MQVAACQLDVAWEDKEANFARVRELLAAAHIEPGGLLVLPEMFATGFSMDAERLAEGPHGPTHEFLSGLAAEHRCNVLAGLIRRSYKGAPHNEALLLGPSGHEITRYAKLQPFALGGEARHYAAGGDVTVVECQGFQLAPLVCYDLRFPEVARRTVRRGANLIAVIASWPVARHGHWLTLLKARAIENQCYVVGVNRAGRDPGYVYAGGSSIYDFGGNLLAEAGDGPQVITADLQLEPLIEYRRALPFLQDMRDDFFA